MNKDFTHIVVGALAGLLAAFALSGCRTIKQAVTPKEPELNWTYGGFNGSKAQPSAVNIDLTAIGKNDMRIRWNTGMGVWGYKNDQADGLACLFVRCNDGKWRGGKFEWISTSRSERSFNNIVRNGYGGWTLSNVPNPCDVIFVVVSKDGKHRSNFTTGVWQR